MALCFFLAAGRLDVPRAWLFFGIYLTGAIAGAAIMRRYAPDLANRRASIKEGTKTWDKVFLAVYFLISLFVAPIVAGLDVGRYQWSYLGPSFAIIGFVLYAASFVLAYWAMVVNEHFEATVRIQTDRGHKVITTGPYRFVRHPGYLGMIIGGFGVSFLLGSAYSLIPVAGATLAVVVRTYLEDRLLCNELEGYADYARTTRYRLIIGVW